MYYKEYLRTRSALIVFTIVGLILTAIPLVIAAGAHLDMGDPPGAKPGAVHELPWVALLGVASLVASVMATVLGSSLSQENDGHLELACTKPYSRTKYAATTMAIDMAAIVASMLIAFVLIEIAGYLIHVFSHRDVRFIAGPDATVNAIRFTLFPLAWYAVIAALSAGTRGKAGVVQGLIWPVTLGLAGAREAPFGSVWHNIFVVLNTVNPLIYASYQDPGDITIVGVSPLHVVTSAVMLAVLVVAGWVVATIQWRRVEA